MRVHEISQDLVGARYWQFLQLMLKKIGTKKIGTATYFPRCEL